MSNKNQVWSNLIAVTFTMIMIYIICFANNEPQMSYVKGFLLYHMISFLIQLNANCLICGSVYDESDKLLAALDSIDINTDSDDKAFRETLLFLSMSRDLKFGFSIGGFMPLKRTTLLSVCYKSCK